MDNYLPRLIDSVLQEKLNLFGAVLLEGCKWCGKSTTAKQLAKSSLNLQNPVTRQQALQLIDTQPSSLLAGHKPRLIDEWQDIPHIWDAIRYDLDQSNLTGQYILTGSATPTAEKPWHSGIGRIARLKMRPMSLFESGESNGTVSLSHLFHHHQDVSGTSSLTLNDIATLCARGGWPASVTRSSHTSKIAREYLNSIIQNDLSFPGIFTYKPGKMRLLLRSIARNVASPLNFNTILQDTHTQSDETIARNSIVSYIDILTSLHIIDNINPWSPHLRSKAQIRSSPKLNLVDPSLAVAALHARPQDLINDLRTFGLVFESLALRDLQIYLQHLDGEVLYYRDNTGLECDAILHLFDGQWAGVEIKLGSGISIDAGVKTLTKLRHTINTQKMQEPAFMMILTATGQYAYKRQDDILVVPIGCLRS